MSDREGRAVNINSVLSRDHSLEGSRLLGEELCLARWSYVLQGDRFPCGHGDDYLPFLLAGATVKYAFEHSYGWAGRRYNLSAAEAID
jgi:hypothetical protein